MSNNIIKDYIELNEKEILEYMRLIFENAYNKQIALRYLDAYNDVRFYNFYKKDDDLTFRKNYLNAIKEREQRVINEFPEKEKIVKNMGLFFYYILYLDKISYRLDIEEIVDKLYKIRKKLLKKDNQDFRENFIELYKKFSKEKENYLKKYETDEFYLKIKRYDGVNNVHNVKLMYNFKMPELYSQNAIEKAFNQGIILEDKLFIEYSLISLQVIDDILKGNFKKQYIIEFDSLLFNKMKKIKSLLNIIDNPAIQDKLNLKIKYRDFIFNKDLIYDLMREGYRFAVVLDEGLEIEYMNFERLNVFNYTIASKNLSYYNKVLENEGIINRLIKI